LICLKTWITEGFEAFRRGTFGNGGQNHGESAPSYVCALDDLVKKKDRRIPMNERKECIISDIPARVREKEQVSPLRMLDKWEAVPYETRKIKGTMLYAVEGVRPRPVTLELGLTGWYRVFVAMFASRQNLLNLRFTNDPAWAQVGPAHGTARNRVQEFFWRCVDLTGQELLADCPAGILKTSSLAWLRFVPMAPEEVAAYKADMARKDTKRIYATHDMHWHLYSYLPQTAEDWYCIVENHRDSDVESLSMENSLIYDGEPSTGDAATLAYAREGDRNVQFGLKNHFTYELLNDLVGYGHRELGIEMYISLRMAAWGIEFPMNQMYFDNKFLRSHMELRCVDRLGNFVESASYAYPETRRYIQNQFSNMAATDCDGVEMMFHRVTALVLFEKPFVDLFAEKYPGVDPRELPAADKRIVDIRCRIMTGFVTELRERIDRERAQRGQPRCKLIVRTHSTIHNTKLLGVDVEAWAKQGLIDKIVVYPMLIDEDLSGDVWQDGDKSRIDLKKYEAFAMESDELVISRRASFEYPHVEIFPPYDGEGDPATDEERIAQWQALSSKYGVKVYHDIQPRQMPPAEMKRRALELYSRGAENFSLWDTYSRLYNRTMWSMAGRIGHKEELASFPDGEGQLYTNHRLLSIGGENVSMYLPFWGG